MTILGPRPTAVQTDLSSARRAVLDVVTRGDVPCTIADVGAALGLHPNTVRDHLEALARDGLVTRSVRPPVGRGRPATIFAPAPAALPVGPEYAVLAEVLVEHLALTWPDADERAAQALTAGHTWGKAIRARQMLGPAEPAGPGEPAGTAASAGTVEPAGTAARTPRATASPTAELAGALDRAGFAPEEVVTADGTHVQRLRACPVLALARRHPDVVCNAHLGMAREILGARGVAPDRVSLAAFAEPGACLLTIAPTPPHRAARHSSDVRSNASAGTTAGLGGGSEVPSGAGVAS